MANHYNEVGQAAKDIFSDVKSIGKRVLDRFYEGFALALKDVCSKWKTLKPEERKLVFERVQECACKLIVDKKERGGEAEDGLARGTFDGYVCKVKRALIYHVPLHVAERATNQELQKAHRYVVEVLKEIDGTLEEKMVKGYEWVKAEQIKEKDRLREEAEKHGVKAKSSASIQTPFTLPYPDDYEDEDSAGLLNSGIHGILAWLQSKTLQPHLKKDSEAATVLRRVLGELVAYENSQEKPAKAVA